MKRSIAALVLATGLATGLAFAGGALAQGKLDKVVKIGALGDQSGLYQESAAPARWSPRKWPSRIPD